jgi:hypothetical protein
LKIYPLISLKKFIAELADLLSPGVLCLFHKNDAQKLRKPQFSKSVLSTEGSLGQKEPKPFGPTDVLDQPISAPLTPLLGIASSRTPMDLEDDLLDRLIRTHRVGLLEFTGLGRGLLPHALLSLAHADSYNDLLRGI